MTALKTEAVNIWICDDCGEHLDVDDKVCPGCHLPLSWPTLAATPELLEAARNVVKSWLNSAPGSTAMKVSLQLTKLQSAIARAATP